MISEGSRDTEDWSNDAEKSALHHWNKLLFKINFNRKVILNCNNISQYYCYYYVFDHINVAYINLSYAVNVSLRDFFIKHKKILPTLNF